MDILPRNYRFRDVKKGKHMQFLKVPPFRETLDFNRYGVLSENWISEKNPVVKVKKYDPFFNAMPRLVALIFLNAPYFSEAEIKLLVINPLENPKKIHPRWEFTQQQFHTANSC